MDKKILLVALFLASLYYTNAAPAPETYNSIKSFENVQMQESYHFAYESADGSYREEMGIIMNPGTPEEELVVMGQYSYKNADDTYHTVMYTSGKEGYRPKVMLKSKERPKAMVSGNALKSLVG